MATICKTLKLPTMIVIRPQLTIIYSSALHETMRGKRWQDA